MAGTEVGTEPDTTYLLVPDPAARRRHQQPWLEVARPPGGRDRPEERPALTVGLRLDLATVPFTATFDEAFTLVSGLFMRGGTDGVERFFRDNDMIDKGTRKYPLSPETFLPGDLKVVYRLLDAARSRVREIADDVTRRIQDAGAGDGLARLGRAHAQIEQQTGYLRGPGLEAGLVLDDRVPASVYTLATGEAVAGLLDELRRSREILTELEVATGSLRAARDEATKRAFGQLTPFAFITTASGGPVDNPVATRALNALVEADPTVQQRQAGVDELRARLHEQLSIAGQTHPVLFRIYNDADPADPAGVAATIVAALRRAHAANHSLQQSLRDDPGDVWNFPPTVREALADRDIPDVSIAWAAAEERILRAQGPRLATQLGTVSGLAAAGVGLLGASAAPPLAIAIAIADGIVNAVDALQEYLAYRQLRAGFDAVLDPSLALGSEPGLLGTVLTIAFDLLALVPVPGGGQAAQP